MATSGTATFNLDILDIVEESYERAGMDARTGYDFRTARRSLNLLAAEWSNRGLNLWTVEQGSQLLTPGLGSYDLPADTMDVIDAAIRSTVNGQSTDYVITRVGVSDWASIVNKATSGRPVQYYIERLIQPRINLWPVPTTPTSGTLTLLYWRMRRIQDATTGTLTMDIPVRFLPALCAGLAYYLALKKPALAPRLPILKADYEEQMKMAMDEDRGREAASFTPWMSW